MPTFSLTPLLVKQHFGGGINEVALMEGLSGVGMIVGGVLISIFPAKRPILILMVSFVVSCGTVALTALAGSNAFWLAIVWWVVSGLTFSTGNAPMMSVLQTVVPNHMQGRVLSLMSTIMGLAGPIGLAIAAPLGEAFGVRSVFIGGGVLSALVCLLALFSPAMWKLEKATIEGLALLVEANLEKAKVE